MAGNKNRRVLVSEITQFTSKIGSAKAKQNGPGSATNTVYPGPNH